MASARDELRSELARDPVDATALRRFSVACLADDALGALHDGVAPLVREAVDGDALRPLACSLAEALRERAEALEDQAEAHALYLRAARLFGEVGGAPVAAAEALARAWRIHPDERISAQVHALLGRPALADAPEYLLVALSLVGAESARVQSLRRLAATELEARRTSEARALYEELRTLRPDDSDAALGIAAIEELETSAARDVREARERVSAEAKGPAAAEAWTRLGDAERTAGDTAAAELAYRRALAADTAPRAEAGLEALLRDGGRQDELATFWAGLLERASRERQVLLRRRLYRLLHDDLGRHEEARQYLVLTAPAATTDATDVVERARAAGAAGDWPGAVQLLEEGLSSAPSKDAKIAMLMEQARVLESELDDLAGAERAYRRVRVTDPRDIAALSFYRRWYAEHDEEPRRAWANLAQLYAVLDAPEVAAERIDVAREMAQVAEHGLQSWDKAVEAWRRVLEDGPGDPEALAELRRIYERSGRWHALVDHLEQWLKGLPAEAVEQKVELLFQIIEIYQDSDRLPMDEMVVQTYERIVELSPTNRVALDGLAGSLAQREKWSELAVVLARKIEVTESPDELVELFEQIASLYLDQIRSESQAIPVLERILELVPTNLDVLHRLKDIYRRRHDAERLYATYERELALLDGPDRLEVLVELASLASDPLFRHDEAVRWWREVLVLEPRHERARAALQELHAEQEDWGGYVALLEQRLTEARTRKQKVELLLELGEIVYSRLHDEVRAQSIFAQIAELSPFNTTARQFLQRLYVGRRAWVELAALYAPRGDWQGYTALLADYAERAADRFLAADIHIEIARALDEHLGDAPGAVRHLEFALKAAPERVEVARALVARYDAGVKAERRIPALEALAVHTEDATERFASWRALAQLQTAEGDLGGAFVSGSHALVAEASLGTVDGIAAFEAAAAAAGRWEPAYAALQEALGRLPNEAVGARIRLYRSLGSIASARLARHTDAVQHFRWVLQLAPADEAALDALEKIHFSQNDFEGLEGVFKARADAARTPEERVAPLLRLGQLYEDVLADTPRAALVYQELLAIAPGDEEAQDAVVRVLESEGAFADLAAAFETALTRLDDRGQRQRLHLRLAAIYGGPLDQPFAAVDHYQELVDQAAVLGASEIAALEALGEDPRTRAAAMLLLEEIYRRHNDPENLVRVLSVRLEGTGGTGAAGAVGGAGAVAERLGLLDEIAMLSEGALGDPQGAFDAMVERFRTDPADGDTWRELERLAELNDGWDDLAAVWRERVDAPDRDGADGGDDHGALGLPPERRAALRMALADVYHRRLIEVDDAVTQVEGALAETRDPARTLLALEALEVLYKKAANLEGYVRVKLAASERVISRDARRRKILDACQAMAGPLGRPDEAIVRCTALFDEDPSDSAVGEALGSTLLNGGRFAELEALYTRRLAVATDGEQAAALHFARALLRRDRLGRWEEAINELLGLVDSAKLGWDARQALLEISRAQESAPQREVILEALRDHYAVDTDPEGSLAVLMVQAEFAPPGATKAALLRAAGATCLPDVTRAAEDRDGALNAFDLYSQALYEAPEDPEALAALVALAEPLEHWDALVEVLEQSAQSTAPMAALEPVWTCAAEVAERQLDDPGRAIAAWRQVVALPAVDPGPALAALERLYTATGELAARLEVLGLQRARAADDGEAIDLLIAEARVLEHLERPMEAVGVLEEALALARNAATEAAADALSEVRAGVVARLETLLSAAGRDDDVVALLLGHAADQVDPDDARLLAYRAAEVAAERCGDRAQAAAIYDSVLAEHPHDEVALGELVALYGALGDWAAQAAILETRLEVALEAGAAVEATTLRLALGALYDARLDLPEEAVARYAAVLATAPGEGEALARLDALVSAGRAAPTARRVLADAHRRSGDALALAVVLEAQLVAVDPEAAPAATHAELAALYRDLLDAPQQAWDHARAAYAAEPCGDAGDLHREALLALGDAMTAAGDPVALSTLANELLGVAGGIDAGEARLARRLDDVAALRVRGATDAQLLPHWRALLSDVPAHTEALAELERVARATDDDALLAVALRGQVAAVPDEGARTTMRLELGRLLAREGRSPDEAAEVFGAVLAADPSDREAFLALVRLETRRKGWAALGRLFADRLAHQPDDAEESRGLMKRLARLRSQHLQDPAGAVELYGAVLAADPLDAEASAGLEALWGEGRERPAIFAVLEPRYEAAGDTDKLIALYSSTLESEQDPELQDLCLLKMSRLELVQLDRPAAAFATLRALAERLEEPGEQLDQLELLAERAGRWDDLVAFYEQRVASGRADAALMARLARILETKSGDVERAVHFYRFSLEREPRDRAVRDRLVQLLERTKRWGELVALYLVSADETEDDDDRVALLFAASRVLDDELDQPAEAVEQLERVVELRPADPDAHEVIVALLEHTGKYEALHEHLRRWIEQVTTDDQAVELQVRLGRSLAASPETVREGLTELEGVLSTRADHPGAVMALEELLTHAEEDELAGVALDAAVTAATAEAASMLEQIVGPDAPADAMARIVTAQLRAMAPGEERRMTLTRVGGLLAASGEPERAFERYAEALLGDLGDAEVERALEELAAQHGLWDGLVVLYERCVAAAAAHSDTLTQRYLLKVAALLHGPLDRRDEAVRWYEKLLAALPTSRDALEPLAAYYLAHGDAAAEARVLSQWVDGAAHDGEQGTLLRRLAAVRMDQLGDLAGAIDALERTLPEAAGDDDVVLRLERLYVKTAGFDKLVGLYQSALGAGAAGTRALELLAKIAQVCETRLGDPEGARDACREILARDARHGFALTTLERVERALGDWDAVDEVLAWRIEAASSRDMRAKLLVDRAEVAATHRNLPEDALAAMNEADDLVGPGAGPDHLVAGYELLLRSDDTRLEASLRLQRRYKARKAWQRLINAIMIEHRATADADGRVALAERAADVAERKLEDATLAQRLLVAALRTDPAATRLRRLATEMAARTGDWATLTQAGEAILAAADDGELVREVGLWLGPLLWLRREDPRAAIRAYEAVLGVDPGQREAAAELCRLYEAVGDWRGLRDLLQERLPTAADDEREGILLQMAAVVAEHESPGEAVPILRDVLHARPDSSAALAQLHAMLAQRGAGAAAAEVLEPIYRASEAWAPLVDLYEGRAATADRGEEKAAHLRAAAAVQEEHMGDRNAALKTLARAVHASPDDRASLRQLERLGAVTGAWELLVRVLAEVRPRMSDRATQRDALLQMAQIHEIQLAVPEKAIVNLLAVLELEPRHRGAMVGLHRLYLHRRDLQALADMTRTLTALEPMHEARRGLWDQLYGAAAEAGDTDLMMTACLAMLDLEEGDREAAARLLPLYEAEGLYPEMGGLLAMLAAAVGDSAEEARLKFDLARLRESRLADRAGAMEAFEEAYELDPTLTEAAERLETYYQEDARWANLASLLRARIARTEDGETRVGLSLRLARLLADELRNPEEAIRTYMEVLDAAPKTLAAYDALVALYAKQRRYLELARTLTGKAAVQGASAEGLTTRVQAAAVVLDQLEDVARAAAMLGAVLAESPDHADAMLLMARLKVKLGEPAEAARLLEALAPKTEGMRRFRILLELARLHGEVLGDAARALPFALEARVLAPDNAGIHRLLRPLLERTGSWGELVRLLEDEYEQSRDAGQRARRALALARVHHEHTGDADEFALWYARAEEAAPDDVQGLELAVAHLTQREAWTELAPRLERLVELLHALHQGEAVTRRAHELGRLFERLGDDTKAGAAYRRALEADGTFTPNLLDHGRLLVRGQHWAEATKVYQSLLMQSAKLEDDADRDEVLYHLALASVELGQVPRAKQYLQKLERQAPGHAGAAELRARVG